MVLNFKSIATPRLVFLRPCLTDTRRIHAIAAHYSTTYTRLLQNSGNKINGSDVEELKFALVPCIVFDRTGLECDASSELGLVPIFKASRERTLALARLPRCRAIARTMKESVVMCMFSGRFFMRRFISCFRTKSFALATTAALLPSQMQISKNILPCVASLNSFPDFDRECASSVGSRMPRLEVRFKFVFGVSCNVRHNKSKGRSSGLQMDILFQLLTVNFGSLSLSDLKRHMLVT